MTAGPFDNIWQFFTKQEREILLRATVEDMLAPYDAIDPEVPVDLRARFMARVRSRAAGGTES